LLPVVEYDSHHLCHTPLTLNFGMKVNLQRIISKQKKSLVKKISRSEKTIPRQDQPTSNVPFS
jgi:hypothetical protein